MPLDPVTLWVDLAVLSAYGLLSLVVGALVVFVIRDLWRDMQQ